MQSFDSPDALQAALSDVGYLANTETAMSVYLASQLQKPVLCEGPAGTGKTELAKAMARLTGARLIRLQCYEGLDEGKALYEWDYKRQLLRIQASGEHDEWSEVRSDVFDEEFLLERPLLAAIRSKEPVILLIDEVDRVEVETEALLLEVLSEYQISIPELGTITAAQIPMVFLTSNNTRELSEALKRRCLFLHLGYPTVEREHAIIRTHVPDIDDLLASEVAKRVAALRSLGLQKSPSVSEAIDWARTLVVLGSTAVGPAEMQAGLPLLLKYQSDIERAEASLRKGA